MQINNYINKQTRRFIIAGLSIFAVAALAGSQYFLQSGQSTEGYTKAAALGAETTLTPAVPSATPTPYSPLNQFLNGSISMRHFSWTGVPQRQFTDEEIEKIATQSTIEIIPKFHALWDYTKHHPDALRLKARNPNIKVLVYQSARFVFPKAIAYEKSLGFKDEWLFLDKDGLPISLSEDKEQILYVDVSNPEYRAWVIQKLRNYLEITSDRGIAAYDGIAFDSARFIAEGNTPTRKAAYTKLWTDLLSYDPVIAQQRIDTWNQGMRLLLQEVKVAFPGKILLYNGFADKAISSNRNLELFQYVDMGLNEDFCIAGPIETRAYLTSDQVQADLDLMRQYAKQNRGKTLLQKANFSNARNSDEFGRTDVEMARYCFGVYMLGAYADRTYFKLGGFYNAEEANQFVVESKIRLGSQKSDYTRVGDLFYREFQNAYVYVNTGNTDVAFQAPANVVLANGAILGRSYRAGDTITIPQHEAYFLLKDTAVTPSFTLTPTSTSTPTPTLIPTSTPTMTPTPTAMPSPTRVSTPTSMMIPTKTPTPTPTNVPAISVKDTTVAGNLITNNYLPDFRCSTGYWCRWYRNTRTSVTIKSNGNLSLSTARTSGDYGACWIQWISGAKADGSTYRIRAIANSNYPTNAAFIQVQTYSKENYLSQPWLYVNGTASIDKTVVIKDSNPNFVAIKYCTWGSSTGSLAEAALQKISFEKIR